MKKKSVSFNKVITVIDGMENNVIDVAFWLGP